MKNTLESSGSANVSEAIIVLRPSRIEGVGCFTLAPIKAKQIVKNLWDDSDVHFIATEKVASELLPLYERYCVKSPDGYWCPLDFRRMSVGWYLNHSKQPNLGSSDGGISYYALRDIEAGEELTIDYKLLDDDVDNSVSG